VYAVTGTTFFIVDIKKNYKLPETIPHHRLLNERHKREIIIPEEFCLTAKD
jgi:hypothetical protein